MRFSVPINPKDRAGPSVCPDVDPDDFIIKGELTRGTIGMFKE
jgi:hypothetical protein